MTYLWLGCGRWLQGGGRTLSLDDGCEDERRAGHGPQPARENDRERFELLHHYRGLGRAVGRSQIQGDCNFFFLV